MEFQLNADVPKSGAGAPSPQPSPLAKSGLPDFGTKSAQVEQARLAMAREFAEIADRFPPVKS
jgi:hypothetical protein